MVGAHQRIDEKHVWKESAVPGDNGGRQMDSALYLEHLSDTDISLLARVTGWSPETTRAFLRDDAEVLPNLLRSDRLHEALFADGDGMLHASPFLLFASLVERGAADLRASRFVAEWMGPGRRLPVFEVQTLHDFAGDARMRLFLAELLASYTHVASGSYWTSTRRGPRRRRFSELDPLRLIEMIDAMPEPSRPPLYRRLGDLSLFLAGVFPDYAGERFLVPIARQRLQRALAGTAADADTLGLLEELGRRSYRLAQANAVSALLRDVADGFYQARRTLNFLTDRYLFPYRDLWFPTG